MSSTNYQLNTQSEPAGALSTVKKMLAFLKDEKVSLAIAIVAMLVNSAATFVGPYIIGRAIDRYVIPGNFRGVLVSAAVLVAVYAVAFVSNYVQMMRMGMVGQRTLFAVRNLVFSKLQELPVAFFSQNKAGDLISRINSDTEKLNQFFSEIVVRFVGIIVTILGVGAFLIGISPKLGVLALIPAVLMVVITRLLSGWIKKRNAASLQATGALSAEVQESLNNFKVVVAFGRRDYFRDRFNQTNDSAYQAATASGLANAIPAPIYEFGSIAAQMIVLLVGVAMVSNGSFTVGLLVSFFVYINQFYGPLRQISYLWSGLQTALAAWDRVSVVLNLESSLVPAVSGTGTSPALLAFKDVSFGYLEGQHVLKDISLELEKGKTYALVGPTGGGKTTTASLMARLYDPVAGSITLNGKDLRSYTDAERADLVGFILQDPFMFTGTVKENIFYANRHYPELSDEEAKRALEDAGLADLLERFDGGLNTEVSSSGGTLSLGQRQIIAFMRAVLRKPALLILDEATANIDTVTEQVLEDILAKLPSETTRVIIAHRLNTIQNADQIFFVNGGTVTAAGDMEHALELLMHGKRTS